jgi:hypothetical protein
MTDFTRMKQAAAVQAVGGTAPITPRSSRATAPGLTPTGTTPTQRPVSATFAPSPMSPTAPMSGNRSSAPQGVGLGGAGLDWLRSLYGR